MNDALERLIERCLPLPGVTACSVRLPDRTFLTRCHGDWFTPAQVEQAVNRLALAADSLGQHGIQPTRLSWVFENIRIHLVLRGDAACLGLFVETPNDGTLELDRLLEEFGRTQGP
jgi:hypothetical protein